MRRRVLSATVALVVFGNVGEVKATPFPFVEVVATESVLPGGSGFFKHFQGVSLNGGQLVFLGLDEGANRGIYKFSNGILSVVADTNTTIPGGTGNFSNLHEPSFDGVNVMFSNQPPFFPKGLYVDLNGTLTVVADRSTPVPGGIENSYFFSFGFGNTDGEFLAFRANVRVDDPRLQTVGIYADLGQGLTVVADETTPVPGGSGNFVAFRFLNPSLDDGMIAFRGGASNEHTGIYKFSDGTLSVIADTSTAVPGGTGNFLRLFSVFVERGNVVFRARSSVGLGMYTDLGGTLRVVADENTVVPSGSGKFIDFRQPSFDGGNIAFRGSGTEGGEGIYLEIDGTLIKVIDTDDRLIGKTPRFFLLGVEGLSGNQLAFVAIFEDDTSGIFVVTIPEPSTFVLALLATLGLSFYRRRSRRAA